MRVIGAVYREGQLLMYRGCNVGLEDERDIAVVSVYIFCVFK